MARSCLPLAPSAGQCGPYTLPVGTRTLIMGILNMTPGQLLRRQPGRARGRGAGPGAADARGGGRSARCGRAEHAARRRAGPAEEELRRVVPVIERLPPRCRCRSRWTPTGPRWPTRRCAAGAHIVNDITGFREDPAILAVAARHGAAVIAMHIQGRPATMQQHPTYSDLLGEVIAYLRESVAQAVAAGVPRSGSGLTPASASARR